MTIEWRADDRQFHLRNERISLVLRVYEDGSLGHLHLGGPAARSDGRTASSVRTRSRGSRTGSASRSRSRTRPAGPATSGSRRSSRPRADGATALTLALPRPPDRRRQAVARAACPPPTSRPTPRPRRSRSPSPTSRRASRWTCGSRSSRDRPVIARSATIRNAGSAPADLRCAMSLALDLPDADWMMVGLAGAWARERHVVERRWSPAASRPRARAAPRATSTTRSSRSAAPTTDEAHGEAYGFSLVYSGNFLAEAEVEPYGTTRVRLGIEPEHVRLAPRAGRVVRDARGDRRLLGRRPRSAVATRSTACSASASPAVGGATAPRPVLINNWEATYFDFDADKLVEIAASAQDLGVELFVLDDGWFGERDDDTTSLGDWVVDRRKLPDGLDGVAGRITALGHGLRPLDRARDGQRRERPVPGPPGLGDRHPRPAADREPPAARPRHGPARGRRPPDRGPDRGPRERADLVRQVGHEPQHHRAVVGRRCRPTGRASSSTATSSASTSCTGA